MEIQFSNDFTMKQLRKRVSYMTIHESNRSRILGAPLSHAAPPPLMHPGPTQSVARSEA